MSRRTINANALQHQLMKEGAENLGTLGRELEMELRTLHAFNGDTRSRSYQKQLYACAHVVWKYFVQREACGLRKHEPVIEAFQIPPEVLARVGAKLPAIDSAPTTNN